MMKIQKLLDYICLQNLHNFRFLEVRLDAAQSPTLAHPAAPLASDTYALHILH